MPSCRRTLNAGYSVEASVGWMRVTVNHVRETSLVRPQPTERDTGEHDGRGSVKNPLADVLTTRRWIKTEP